MLYPDSILEEIKARFDLVGYVSRYVSLKRAGANFKGLCPFHQEKTPSFNVNPAKGIFKCFGCHKGGDLFSFMMAAESVSFPESVRLLAREANVDLTAYEGKDTGQKSENDQLYKINDAARDFFQKALESREGLRAREYLEKRGLKPETVSRFSLGFAPGNGNALLSFLVESGFEEALCLKAGLIIQRDSGGLLDKFRNRFMIPIQNLSGLTCGFTGRVLSDEDNPKYLNSPETPVFQKGRLLYGLLQARDEMRREGRAILVEGNVDLLSVVQAGIGNVAASSGTAFTDTQALLLKRFCDKVVIVYDGDNAGQNAAARGISILINAGLAVRVAVLPRGEDPDTFVRQRGTGEFKTLLDQARDIADFTIDRFSAANDLTQAENKAKLATELAPLLLSVTDPVIRSELVRKSALRLGVREELIMSRLVKKPASRSAPKTGPAAPEVESTGRSRIEERIVELLVLDDPYLAQVRKYLTSADFHSAVPRVLFTEILDRGTLDSEILNRLTDSERDFASHASLQAAALPDPARATETMTGLILKLRECDLKDRMADLRGRMAIAGDDRDALLREFNTLSQELQT